MNTDELKFFLRYAVMQFVDEVKGLGKSLAYFTRPKFWFYLFLMILVFQILFNNYFHILITLCVMVAISLWQAYDSGHWRNMYRKETLEKLKKKERQEKRSG